MVGHQFPVAFGSCDPESFYSGKHHISAPIGDFPEAAQRYAKKMDEAFRRMREAFNYCHDAGRILADITDEISNMQLGDDCVLQQEIRRSSDKAEAALLTTVRGFPDRSTWSHNFGNDLMRMRVQSCWMADYMTHLCDMFGPMSEIFREQWGGDRNPPLRNRHPLYNRTDSLYLGKIFLSSNRSRSNHKLPDTVDTEDGHSRDSSETATVIEEGTPSEHQHRSGRTISLNEFFANMQFPFRFDPRPGHGLDAGSQDSVTTANSWSRWCCSVTIQGGPH